MFNYVDDVTLDYTELQDRLYNKVDSKLRNYDFLVKKRKLFFDISQVTYSEKKVQPIDEYNIVFSNEELCTQIVELMTFDFTEDHF